MAYYHTYDTLGGDDGLVEPNTLQATFVDHDVVVALVPRVLHHLGLGVAVALLVDGILMGEDARIVADIGTLQLFPQGCVLGGKAIILAAQTKIVTHFGDHAIATASNGVAQMHQLRTLVIAVLRDKNECQYLQNQKYEHIIKSL